MISLHEIFLQHSSSPTVTLGMCEKKRPAVARVGVITAAMAETRSSLCAGATEAAQTSPRRHRSLFNETSPGAP